ncbi:MAG TPA: trp operon repressor [Legionella sp.]|nr:trp operon repressor [Legionella sp.]
MNQHGWQYFLELCVAAEDVTLVSELFDLLFTHEERAGMETRCLIVKELLAQEKTQRQMAHDLQVSIAKITRGSNELKNISPKLKAYLQKHLQ